MKMQTTSVILLLTASIVLGGPNCLYHEDRLCQIQRNWHLGIDRVKPSGAVVHGHVNGPLVNNPSGKLDGNLHGSRVFGGPYNGAQTVGGGLNYQHNNGLHGGVDATHSRGQGTQYSATVGGSTRMGPGTLSVGGGANTIPGSSRIQGQVGATYTVPLP